MATTQRDLRSGHPIWAGRRAADVAHQRLERDIATDVLVIGAGITGAMITDALTTAGLDVVVVDKRGLAKGSTVASTALVLYEIDTPLITLARKTGKLRRRLHRLFPKLNTTVAYAWTGTFGETTTDLPIIGPVPGMPRCWIALGYGGNGTTYAAIAAGAIAGRPDADADLYRFAAHAAAE